MALLGGLTALVVSATGGDDAPVGSGRVVGLPDGLLVPVDPDAAPVAGAGPGGVVGAASGVACRADVEALEGAMAAARVTLGHVPATLPELVAGGFLSELPARRGFTFAPEVVGGSATGKVTVNGRPGAEGCAAPAG